MFLNSIYDDLLEYYHLLNTQKSMRRRTFEVNKGVTDHVIKSNKKYSFQSKHKLASAGELYPHFKVSFDSAFSEAVAKTFLEDLLESLEPKLRKSDQKQFFNRILQHAFEMEYQVQAMLDPMSQHNKKQPTKPSQEIEPPSALGQAYCGGRTVCVDHKVVPKVRPSIRCLGSNDSAKEINPSKPDVLVPFSSKCLIKLTKQQKLEQNRSIQALRLSSQQPSDRHEDLIKEKLFRQSVMNLTTNLFRSKLQAMDKTNSKFNNNLTAVDQYSYDYDGAALPLKKFGRPYPEKVKILNPTYKVTHKDVVQLRKVKTSKYNFLSAFRFQEEEAKPKVQAAEIHQLNLGRKPSTRDCMNDLTNNENKQEQDYLWRRKFQELMKSKSIRIRQLKQS